MCAWLRMVGHQPVSGLDSGLQLAMVPSETWPLSWNSPVQRLHRVTSYAHGVVMCFEYVSVNFLYAQEAKEGK